MTANALWDSPGARRIAKRVGRGQGSGKGKTCGRGHKGTYARAGGKINRGFEGGQSQMSLRFPKRGFRSRRFNNDNDLETLNLGRLAYAIEKGDLNASEPITMKALFESGVVTKIKNGVKVLGKGAGRIRALGVPINLEVSDATEGAIEAVS